MAAPCAVLIAGPTAGGKSQLALALAEATGGAIVNADSMQVYRDLRVLTARPSEAEEARVPHHLYGCLDGAERCSAGRWSRMAASVLAELEKSGRPAIVTGGTGLYFKALLEGLTEIPAIPDEVRQNISGLLEQVGPGELHNRLSAVDPETARQIRPSDSQRIQRAFEVWSATGRGLSAWRSMPGEPVIRGPVVKLVIEVDRDVLYERCDRRFERMIEDGALDEVEALAGRSLDPGLPIMKAVGVPQLTEYLQSRCSFNAAVEGAKQMTRRYAKRQMTWFRHQMADWDRIGADDPRGVVERIAKRVAKIC